MNGSTDPDHAGAARLACRALQSLLSFACALILFAALPGLAWAQAELPDRSPGPKSIAVYVEGPDAAAVRSDVLMIVPKTLTVIDGQLFASALARAGQHGELGNAITSKAQRERQLARIRKAAADVKADAVIVGRVRPHRGGGKEVWLLLVDAIPGDLAVDDAIVLPADASARQDALAAVLTTPLKELSPPAPKAPEAPPPAEEKKEEAPARAPHDEATSLFKLGIAFDLGGRWFSYHDGVTANLRPYNVFPAPTVTLSGEVYPAATTGVAVLKDLGLRLHLGHALGLSSSAKGGTPIDTQWNRFGVDLHGRLRTGTGAAPVLGAGLGMEWIAFWFNDAGALASEVPTVSYKALRLGVDARVPLGRVGLGVDLAYLAPLAAGVVYDRFTDPSVKGVDLGAKLTVGIAAGFQAELGLDYTRFFASFSPVPGDAYVAGGALDQMLALRLGAAYVY